MQMQVMNSNINPEISKRIYYCGIVTRPDPKIIEHPFFQYLDPGFGRRTGFLMLVDDRPPPPPQILMPFKQNFRQVFLAFSPLMKCSFRTEQLNGFFSISSRIGNGLFKTVFCFKNSLKTIPSIIKIKFSDESRQR